MSEPSWLPTAEFVHSIGPNSSRGVIAESVIEVQGNSAGIASWTSARVLQTGIDPLEGMVYVSPRISLGAADRFTVRLPILS